MVPHRTFCGSVRSRRRLVFPSPGTSPPTAPTRGRPGSSFLGLVDGLPSRHPSRGIVTSAPGKNRSKASARQGKAVPRCSKAGPGLSRAGPARDKARPGRSKAGPWQDKAGHGLRLLPTYKPSEMCGPVRQDRWSDQCVC